MFRSRRVIMAVLSVVAVSFAVPAIAAETDKKLPEHRVLAMYFHRTQRCPTCMKMGTYTEEALKKGFPKQLKDRSVSVHMIDFQDPKNEKHTKYYKIEGPTLIVANVVKDRVTDWKPMPKIWSFVGKKEEFFKYVQDGVRGYLESKEAK